MAHKVAVIAGVGEGLGSALVRRFANEGFTVFAAARNADKLSAKELGNASRNVVTINCDVTISEQVEELFDTASKEGTIEFATFNAGAFERSSVLEIDPADFERCWRVGCLGGLLVGQQAAKAMLTQGRGTIVFTGATASLRGSAHFANLAVPKFGLRALAQSMARELGPRGIHVAHSIIDGQILSQRYEHLVDERGPDSLLEPDEIAESYWTLHNQKRSAWTFELDLRPWVEGF
jgi:NAD(P)-dependent dehydrogenase (short-subunit alcohol dehydrogenase family)